MKMEMVDNNRVLMVTGERNASGHRNQQWLLRLEDGLVVARRKKFSREALASFLNVDPRHPLFARLCYAWETAYSLDEIEEVID